MSDPDHAYESRKLQGAEKNYTVCDKEILAIVHAFKTWRCYLTGADVTVRTDHKSLQYLRAQPNLSPRQIRWLDFLESNFHYAITYKRGANNIADALTRPTAYTTAILIAQTSPLLTGLFNHGYKIDPFFRSAIHQQHTTITGVPAGPSGNDAILVVIDRLTKMTHFIACQQTITAEQTVQLFIANVIRLHGLPTAIISDQDPKFTSNFWRHLWDSSAPNYSFPLPTTHTSTGRPNESTKLWSNSFGPPVLTHRHGRNPFRYWNSRITTHPPRQRISPRFS
ncbi:hypothetical protein CLOP_g22764 [Closterium sp. NIES-67]|nr:hypothetical protein CLOP_g22764 [Closterium sp. NIES-67]